VAENKVKLKQVDADFYPKTSAGSLALGVLEAGGVGWKSPRKLAVGYMFLLLWSASLLPHGPHDQRND
jgi:hypothetical protein